MMDSPAEERFDRLTRMVSRLLNVPVALVSLVDDHRQFFKSARGLAEPWNSCRETPLSHSFCQHVVTRNQALVINDARTHPLVSANLAIPDLGVEAYLGIPLRTRGGDVLGSLCAIDIVPRTWTETEKADLTDFAALVEEQINLVDHVRLLAELDAERALLSGELSHRVKNVFGVVTGLLRISARDETDIKQYVSRVTGRIDALGRAHDYVMHSSAQSHGRAATLLGLTASLLTGFEGDGDRVHVSGTDMAVGERSASAIALILHELATNAIKYGALSVDAGRVDIASEQIGTTVRLRWREIGGPALDGKPVRTGFGTSMTHRAAQMQLRGEIVQSWNAEGLVVDLTMPLEQLAS
ncbi:GAF domain-containing protein [Pararhizobium sp.]|uniref:GAF domain-containing protein n=1 Tax=Pararhizobium sp. TaxID=1977563 RepID=UPI00271A75AB|nr:GAF domain-containing protein [Pararhizobium sp.]MDO9417199.1 HWE histidine kinase domain-containing protein [Pararhizobium sp.]